LRAGYGFTDKGGVRSIEEDKVGKRQGGKIGRKKRVGGWRGRKLYR